MIKLDRASWVLKSKALHLASLYPASFSWVRYLILCWLIATHLTTSLPWANFHCVLPKASSWSPLQGFSSPVPMIFSVFGCMLSSLLLIISSIYSIAFCFSWFLAHLLCTSRCCRFHFKGSPANGASYLSLCWAPEGTVIAKSLTFLAAAVCSKYLKLTTSWLNSLLAFLQLTDPFQFAFITFSLTLWRCLLTTALLVFATCPIPKGSDLIS